MATEELLRPRVIVGMDWPGNEMPVGTILTMTSNDCYIGYGLIFHKSMVDKHPHLFRKLEWWEHRKPEDLPEYLRCTCNDFITFKVGQIITVEKHQSNTYGQFVAGLFISKDKQGSDPMMNCVHYKNFAPATESEYLQYINQQPCKHK